ncbi:BglG family transcription antiterminator [Isobaculum melis]|uniref:Transcriptional antiterminator n=1 Tax=Isobaculum melis TaxID=142588 RepID=A0A1H9QVF9_9LACT|nr:BglG family transcription antiterminator [Isobaculum melis]SER63819.1 Transcriptional antiterminator [Isobaculum melis]
MVIIQLNKRQVQFISILRKQKGYQTAKEYAAVLNVSERTIHSDLKIIEEQLKPQGIQLDKRPGIGIGLKKLETQPIQAAPKLEVDTFSTAGRREKMMALLLFQQQKVTFEQLSETFMVSKTSIKNDLSFAKKKLTNGNHLTLISDGQGTRLAGSEEDFQKAYLEFNHYLFEKFASQLEVDEEKRLARLSAYYGEDLVKTCVRVLYAYIKNNVTVIAEHYVFNVLNRLIILVYRMQHQTPVVGNQPAVPTAEPKVFFEESAEQMLNKISLRLNVTYTKQDVAYLSKYLLSNRFEPFPKEANDDAFVEKIIAKVGDSLNMDFTQDAKLQEQLKTHIPPMIYRLKSKVKTDNPFIHQIKNEFALTFNVIWVVLSEYEEALNVAFNENEIGFLTIYFQSAIERTKLSKKILIVCPMGIATSELLVNRIKNVLPSFDMMEVASIREVPQLDLADIDLIISTVPLTVPEKKVIVVSPFLNDQDIKNISESYHHQFFLSQEGTDETQKLNHLGKYLKDDLIFFDENFKSKEAVLETVGKKLVDQQYVTKKFVESLKAREEMGGTDLPTGAAIPHGNPKFVKETVIAVVRNKKYFKWNEYAVKTIFIVCIAEKETKEIRNILSDIYQIVEHKDNLNQLYLMSKKEDFRKMIGCDKCE